MSPIWQLIHDLLTTLASLAMPWVIYQVNKTKAAADQHTATLAKIDTATNGSLIATQAAAEAAAKSANAVAVAVANKGGTV
jgi:hypothetical protein